MKNTDATIHIKEICKLYIKADIKWTFDERASDTLLEHKDFARIFLRLNRSEDNWKITFEI